MTDRWSAHAQAYRESEAHRSGADLDLLIEWAEGKTPSTSPPGAATSRAGCARPGSMS
jgi:hypothetical protein